MAYKYIPEWMQARSESAQRGWQTRWERGDSVGPKGEKYLEDKYGPGGYGGDYTDEEFFDDYSDVWDFEYEY